MMLKKIRKITRVSTMTLVWYSILSIILGLTGLVFIMLVNTMIEELIFNKAGVENKTYIYYFIGTIAMFFFSRRILSEKIINLSQKIYWNIRKQIIYLVLKASYTKVKEKQEDIYSSLTNDVGNITNGSLLIIELISSAILIVSCFIYMAYLSLIMFVISLVVILFGVLIHFSRMKNSNKQFKVSRDLENSFIGYFNAILGGKKEIVVNPIIGLKIKSQLEIVTEKAQKNDTKAYVGYLNTQINGQILFYLLITFTLFYSGSLLKIPVEVSISYIFVLLYILSPLAKVMVILPSMSRTLISIDKLIELKKYFEKTNKKNDIVNNDNKTVVFETLKYEDYTFSYEESLFSIGPINFTINKGDIIFIQGANGSGKTTLMNILINVYEPKSGKIILNRNPINSSQLLSFNELFSPVFSDFYLFDEMYGIKTNDTDKINEYLRIFEIDDKITLKNNTFSTLDLSSGQRKRLALINALLEKKPIILLDEWAADQDPEFRRKFYREILPYIKERGFTIIAITHDDKYFDSADKVFKMEYGKLYENI